MLNNVFEKQVKNFDYPSVNIHYKLNSPISNSILKLDNGTDFISQISINRNIYYVASPLDLNYNTLVNSPLIVPIFYNIALQSTLTNGLYYTLNENNKISVNTTLSKDEVLTISNNSTSFIPLQHIKQNSVILETDNKPDKAGFYTVNKSDLSVQNLAFNINRSESKLSFYTKSDLAINKNTNYFTNLTEALQSFKNNTSIFELWKIFIALAVLFFLIELLLLKHLKI